MTNAVSYTHLDFLLLQLIRLHANLEPLRALHHVGGIIAVIALRRAKEQLADVYKRQAPNHSSRKAVRSP